MKPPASACGGSGGLPSGKYKSGSRYGENAGNHTRKAENRFAENRFLAAKQQKGSVLSGGGKTYRKRKESNNERQENDIMEEELSGGQERRTRMVKRAETNDLKTLAALAAAMWKEHSCSELMEEFSEIMKNKKSCFFLKYASGLPVGFAQCQLRYDYVEGTRTAPVGYLEGIFVEEKYRKQGYAKELLAACEAWARSNGCREFASDCEVGNTDSLLFHKAMDFTEANRIICFTKML